MGRAGGELKSRKVALWVPVVVGVVALALGLLLGNTTAIGSKQLTVLDGRAHLHNTENWLTSFDTDDPDDQLTFEANAVHWSDGSRTGYQHPPCLREGRAVPVRVGYTWVDMPGETSRSVVAWVACRG